LERSGAAFDLLLTDIGLPGRTDGRELARRIRLNRPRLPVLFISGHDVTTPPGAREAGESPVVYLPKPFEMTRLA
uniref:response regulator n=2 Tax=Pseudomonadota TaxID=1224 RepID=UPI0013D40412